MAEEKEKPEEKRPEKEQSEKQEVVLSVPRPDDKVSINSRQEKQENAQGNNGGKDKERDRCGD
jgi:hypothetical protein